MPPSSPPRSLCLVVSTLAKPGGAEKIIALMANFWAQRGVRVSVLTFDDPSEPLFFETDPGIHLHRLSLKRRSSGPIAAINRNLRRVRILRRAICTENPDIVISFITAMNVLVLLASTGLQKPVIVCERSVPGVTPERFLWKLLSRLLYRRAASIVVQSRRAAEYFLPTFERRLRIIPNPVLRTGVVRVRRDHNLHELIALGRFSEEKCFDNLISAFSKVADVHPDWYLTIYGDGPLRAELQAQVLRLGLTERVSLPGNIKDVSAKLAKADLFALTSRFEGFPNALCEAMATGLPVISTNCPGGVGDLVRDGEDGILVPVNDVEALAEALHHLMSNPAERERLGGRAREVTERFDVDRIMELWDEALGEACARL